MGENTRLTDARVASLHLHPVEPGEAMSAVMSVELVAEKGIAGNPRYFWRMSRKTGKPSRRQLSLMEREQIAEHAAVLGLNTIAPGAVRANIETEGIDLVSLVGQQLRIGTALIYLYEPRDPCSKMDAICQGLRELMMPQKQGVMAEVIESGTVTVGDEIAVIDSREMISTEK